jgi:hypothetical protein
MCYFLLSNTYLKDVNVNVRNVTAFYKCQKETCTTTTKCLCSDAGGGGGVQL